MPYVLTACYILYIHLYPSSTLNLNTKQKSHECRRTLSRFQIAQNGSRLLSRKSKTSRFGIPSLRCLDMTKEQGKMPEENRVQDERSPELWLTASYGGCIFGIIPCNFSLSFPVLRHFATIFLVVLKGIMSREAPFRVPPCWLLGNIELPCVLPFAACGHVEGPPCMLGDEWTRDLIKDHRGAVLRTRAIPRPSPQISASLCCSMWCSTCTQLTSRGHPGQQHQ